MIIYPDIFLRLYHLLFCDVPMSIWAVVFPCCSNRPFHCIHSDEHLLQNCAEHAPWRICELIEPLDSASIIQHDLDNETHASAYMNFVYYCKARHLWRLNQTIQKLELLVQQDLFRIGPASHAFSFTHPSKWSDTSTMDPIVSLFYLAYLFRGPIICRDPIFAARNLHQFGGFPSCHV